jgi:inner membrane protein
MPNASQHALIGGTAAGITYLALSRYYQRQPDFGEFVTCALLGVAAAGVPDILEPAITPHHRQFAHSITLGTGLTKWAMDFCRRENCEGDPFPRILLGCALAAYLSHLAADFATPRGLPVLGR